jgi:Tfp pilus assembly protein PilX
MRHSNERGIAMITTLLVMMLLSALLVGFTAVVMSDSRYRIIDRNRSQAFYAASAGVEKATAELGNLFFTNIAPTRAQVTAQTTAPTIAGVQFTSPTAPSVQTGWATVGTNGYAVSFKPDASGNPGIASSTPIKSGPFEGLIAQQTPYQIDVSARTASGGEVHLVRNLESVAIPVFQFGMFSDVDLSFFAGPDFDFGGRVHTNGNLFLSQGTGGTLTLRDKVTAVGEVIRQRMQNGASIDTAPAHAGTVRVAKAPATFRPLLRTEGSVVDGVNSPLNDPTWHTTSLATYNSWIRNGRTGAKILNLPLITVGGTNPDLIRRAPANENNTNPVLFGERMFTRASLRILLSDNAADITSLPGVTNTAPVQLAGDWRAAAPNNGLAGYGPVDATHPPIARSLGPLAATTTTAGTAAGDNVVNVNAVPGIFLKPQITVSNAAGTIVVGPFTCTTWTDITFQGCNPAANLTAGWTISATSSVPGVGNVNLTLANNVAAGANRTLNLSASQFTWPLAANTFWLTNGNARSTLVTCTGASAAQFTGCTGVPATAAGATVTSSYASTLNTPTIAGFIKIERQDPNGAWWDVTMEILNYGIGGPNLNQAGVLAGAACGDPTPNAILRLQRLRDNGAAATCPAVNNAAVQNSYDWWPNVLFDAREGLLRDTAIANNDVTLGGVIHYIGLDVDNLTRWFRGTGAFNAGTGLNSRTDNGGFTVYFSDRRNNRNSSNLETGEYGFEDFVNPSVVNGLPNATLDAGEDVNASGTLDNYGQLPNANGTAGQVPFGVAPLDTNARPGTLLKNGQAQVNRAILFRRALKLVRGSNIAGNGVTGLTVVAENPVYVQGDWNATGASFNGTHAATSIIADAVTLLSNAWNDNISFVQPYTPGNRTRNTQTWYRMAIIGGKGMSFPQPNGTPTDFGTDGGAHNFLRYLEAGDQPVNYRGAIATFFYNRQAVGTFKCCATVYTAPQRNYAFDIEFLTPSLLPPNTPVFRDMNAVGFSQEMRPGR